MAVSTRVVVCEKGNKWAVALRRALDGTGYRVVETRSLDECWQELRNSPTSLLALELVPGNAEAMIHRLVDLGRHFRHARAIVVAERELKAYEWVLREAGAAHVLFSTRDMSTATRVVKQHMQGLAEPVEGFHETVWSGLPWASRSQARRSRSH